MNITLQAWHLVVCVALLAAVKLRLDRALYYVAKFFAVLIMMGLAAVSGMQMVEAPEKRRDLERKQAEIKQKDPDTDHDDKFRNWVWDQSYSGQFVSLEMSMAAASEGVEPITPYAEWKADFLARTRVRGA